MQDQTPQIVPASSNVTVVEEGRVQLHRARVPLFEVSDEQLELLAITGQDAGIEFNAFIACASAAIATALTITTTEIPNPNVALWWRSSFVGFIGMAIIFSTLWLRKKGQFRTIITKIRSQPLQ